MSSPNFVLFEEIADNKKNRLGKIILNRVSVLNALNEDMFKAIQEHLLQWQEDASIKAILITSNSDKAFCAGGDIRAIYENRQLPLSVMMEYFRREYTMNRMMYHYQKPIISFLNGITMGGGVGISIHGSHPIGTEKLKLAMPETLIGFFPDVGASYYFSRLPHYIGFYLGLTGDSIGVHDAGALQLIKYFVPSNQLNALETTLIETPFESNEKECVNQIIQHFSEPFGHSELMSRAVDIETAFQLPAVEKIIDALSDHQAWSNSVKQQLLQRSPTSLKISLKQLQHAKTMTFDEVMAMDLKLAKRFLSEHDFFEGIRAMIVDKDKKPHWKPDRLSRVSDKVVDSYFADEKIA